MPEKKAPNPNRQLDADTVEMLFAEKLPHLFDKLSRDREWLWFCGPKPEEKDREVLKELGFGFTPRPHLCESGESGHWYHACGGPVLRRGRNGSKRSRSNDSDSSDDNEGETLADELSRLAATL